MAATILDTVSSHLEQVEQVAARYYDQSTSLMKWLKPSKTVAASRYLYRVPVVKYLGGQQVKFVANGGDMGRGTSMAMSKLEFGYFDSSYNIEVTKEQMDYMKSNGSAMIDVLSEMMSNAFAEVDTLDEIYLFGDGTGKLTNSSSATNGTTTLTFASTTDNLGVNRLKLGQGVDVWDSTGATKRAGGPYTITDIDYTNKIVTFGASVTGITSGDIIAVAGLDSYGPSTLTAGSSTWPGGGLTNADGLTGDSWRHGLQYVNDSTTSTYYAQQLKSSFTQLVPTFVNGQASQLTFDHGELVKNLIAQRRDETVTSELMWVMHQCQVQQLKQNVTAITNFMRTGGPAEIMDLVPTGGKQAQTFMFADRPAFASKRADRSRVDSFIPGNWFRVEGHPSEFFDFGGGQTIRARVSSSTGNTTATYEIKVIQKMDYGCMDPGAGGYIGNLAVSSSY